MLAGARFTILGLQKDYLYTGLRTLCKTDAGKHVCLQMIAFCYYCLVFFLIYTAFRHFWEQGVQATTFAPINSQANWVRMSSQSIFHHVWLICQENKQCLLSDHREQEQGTAGSLTLT